MAFQSVIMLVVLTRVCDVAVAGVFTFAYTSANLFLNVGKYGMRNYQVSDAESKFTFGEYAISRIITCVAMLVFSLIYLSWSAMSLGYDEEKIIVVIVMSIFKLVDAAEDVFHADYQRRERLDIAAKVLTIRLLTTLVVFILALLVFQNLPISLTGATVYTTLFFIFETYCIRRYYLMPSFGESVSVGNVKRLLVVCLPLFLATFLLFYIGNAPKYAIDVSMDDVAQAYYGYIAMPVFIVVLLAGFIYNPMVVPLTQQWKKREVGAFVLRFGQLSLVIISITVVCIALAWIAGVPVLNLLYNAEVSPFFDSLLILVAGGGFLALATLFTLGITIIRFQNSLIWGYGVVALLALFGSSYAVENWGIPGASWIYFILMGILALWFGVAFAIGIKRKSK